MHFQSRRLYYEPSSGTYYQYDERTRTHIVHSRVNVQQYPQQLFTQPPPSQPPPQYYQQQQQRCHPQHAHNPIQQKTQSHSMQMEKPRARLDMFGKSNDMIGRMNDNRSGKESFLSRDTP